MKNTTRKITYGALIIACAVVLPQLFHLSGIPNSGAVFLPMHRKNIRIFISTATEL